MSVAVSLVVRAEGTSVGDGLSLASTLAGGGKQVYLSGTGAAAAWDQSSGQLHTVSAGYVGRANVGVLVGTAGFCSRPTAFTAAEGEALAAALQAIVDSYQ